jgi:hypothetical protein
VGQKLPIFSGVIKTKIFYHYDTPLDKARYLLVTLAEQMKSEDIAVICDLSSTLTRPQEMGQQYNFVSHTSNGKINAIKL